MRCKFAKQIGRDVEFLLFPPNLFYDVLAGPREFQKIRE